MRGRKIESEDKKSIKWKL